MKYQITVKPVGIGSEPSEFELEADEFHEENTFVVFYKDQNRVAAVSNEVLVAIIEKSQASS